MKVFFRPAVLTVLNLLLILCLVLLYPYDSISMALSLVFLISALSLLLLSSISFIRRMKEKQNLKEIIRKQIMANGCEGCPHQKTCKFILELLDEE